MRNEYYGSVKVTYFDKEAVWKALRELAPRLAKAHPEVTKIVVFGSLARDEAAPGSDVDRLLVLEKSDLSPADRFGEYRPERFPVGVEVFAYTEEEVAERLSSGDFFLKQALEEGVTLFDRQDHTSSDETRNS